MKTLNMTQHPATPEQLAAGVVDPSPEAREEISALMTFEKIPSADEIARRAELLAEIACCYDLTESDDGLGEDFPDAAMIGGSALWLMSSLERELLVRGLVPRYAFPHGGFVKAVGTF